jgi:predicted RNA binding protein YcfA (HicA-like mRNA interferase family)
VKAISGKDFARLLEQRSWQLLCIKGSHHIYMKSGLPVRISVPIHGNKPLKVGLLRHLMKVAGIPEDAL